MDYSLVLHATGANTCWSEYTEALNGFRKLISCSETKKALTVVKKGHYLNYTIVYKTYIPSSIIASSWVILVCNLPTLVCRWLVRSKTLELSFPNSEKRSSACLELWCTTNQIFLLTYLLKLLSWRMILDSELLVTHSNSLAISEATLVRLTLTGSTWRLIRGIISIA